MHAKRIVTAMLVSLLLVIWGAAAWAEAPRMSKEKLKSLLGQPDVVIIDVRQDSDWDDSDKKIKGAQRFKGEVKTWAAKLDKAKTYVLYCA